MKGVSQKPPVFGNFLRTLPFMEALLFPQSKETEADIPVPDRLLPKGKSKWLTNRLKLSQKIGLLLWLNREGLLSEGGSQRLLYLQAKASFEAIAAGLKFAERLTKEEKLRSDFRHQLVELNRRPQSKRFRRTEKRRIGVGYRDKGTLPEFDASARKSADIMDFVEINSFGLEVQDLIRSRYHPALEGEWVSLSDLAVLLSGRPGELKEMLSLLLQE